MQVGVGCDLHGQSSTVGELRPVSCCGSRSSTVLTPACGMKLFQGAMSCTPQACTFCATTIAASLPLPGCRCPTESGGAGLPARH